MEKYTFQLFAFQALHFKDFLDKIKIPYKMRFDLRNQLTPDLIIYFDMVLNDMDFIRVSNYYEFLCNCRSLMP